MHIMFVHALIYNSKQSTRRIQTSGASFSSATAGTIPRSLLHSRRCILRSCARLYLRITRFPVVCKSLSRIGIMLNSSVKGLIHSNSLTKYLRLSVFDNQTVLM